MFVYCMNELYSKIQGCYMSLYRAMSHNFIESYQIQFLIYSSQQVRELYPLNLN